LLERRLDRARVVREATDGRTGLRFEGTWTEAEGALEATGPAKLVTLAKVARAGRVALELEAGPGVTLGLGATRFPAPAGARGAVVLATGGDTDALRIEEALRLTAPASAGPRSFSLEVPAGVRVRVAGLQLSRE
jgi:hypothetical protein